MIKKFESIVNSSLKLNESIVLNSSVPNLFELLSNSSSIYKRTTSIKSCDEGGLEFSSSPMRNLKVYIHGKLNDDKNELLIKTKPNKRMRLHFFLYLLVMIVFIFEDLKLSLADVKSAIIVSSAYFIFTLIFLLATKFSEENLKASIVLILRHEKLIP